MLLLTPPLLPAKMSQVRLMPLALRSKVPLLTPVRPSKTALLRLALRPTTLRLQLRVRLAMLRAPWAMPLPT